MKYKVDNTNSVARPSSFQKLEEAIQLFASIELDLDAPLARSLRPYPDFRPQRALQPLLGVTAVGSGRRLFASALSRLPASSHFFRGSDGDVPLDHRLGRLADLLFVCERHERLGMTGGESPRSDQILDVRRKPQQSKAVGDGGAFSADPLGDRFLREVEVVCERSESLGLLDRIELRALDVLDEGQLERTPRLHLLNHGGNLRQSGHARRAPTAFTRDDLVPGARLPQQDRLQEAGLLYRSCKAL